MRSWRTSCIRNKRWFFAVLALLAVVFFLLNLCLGAVYVPPGEILQVLLGRMADTPQARIVLLARLPRACGCLLAGAALAASGS